jgi:hypothetical protein
MSEAAEISRTAIEQRVIDEHTEWMRDNAFGLRMFETSAVLNPGMFANEQLRRRSIEDMGVQIAQDAFKRGFGVIALSAPQYFVHEALDAWMDPNSAIIPKPGDWQVAPPALPLPANSRVEIKIEAFGFPIGKREV